MISKTINSKARASSSHGHILTHPGISQRFICCSVVISMIAFLVLVAIFTLIISMYQNPKPVVEDVVSYENVRPQKQVEFDPRERIEKLRNQQRKQQAQVPGEQQEHE
jgi:hypothetical protein